MELEIWFFDKKKTKIFKGIHQILLCGFGPYNMYVGEVVIAQEHTYMVIRLIRVTGLTRVSFDMLFYLNILSIAWM